MYKITRSVLCWLGLIVSLMIGSALSADEDTETFVFALDSATPIATLDNLDATTSVRLTIVSQLMEGLLRINPSNDKKPELQLAKSYQSVDKLTHVFRLHRDVYFHPHHHKDNPDIQRHALTAEDVKFSLDRAYSSSADYFMKIEKVEAIGKDLVKIKLKEEYPNLVKALATNLGFVTCRSYFEGLGKTDQERAEKFKIRPVGTGPYFLLAPLAQGHSSIIIKSHGLYRDQKWVQAKGTIDTIEFQYVDNAKERVRRLRDGSIQMTSLLGGSLDASHSPTGDGEGSFPISSSELAPPYLGTIAFNTKKPYLKNPTVRRLISSAIDIPAINRVTPAADTDDLPGGYTYYREMATRFQNEYRYLDSERSKIEALEGVRDDLETLRRQGLTLYSIDREDQVLSRLFERIRQDLEETLSIPVRLKLIPRKDLPPKDQLQPYDLFYSQWTPDIESERDNHSILFPLFKYNGNGNKSFYSAADHLFSYVERFPEDMRADLYRKVQDQILEDSPHLWFFSTRSTSLIHQDDFQLQAGKSILIYHTSFLKNLRRLSK